MRTNLPQWTEDFCDLAHPATGRPGAIKMQRLPAAGHAVTGQTAAPPVTVRVSRSSARGPLWPHLSGASTVRMGWLDTARSAAI